MTNFHGLCHGIYSLRYVEGILQPRKLDFRGLRGQFDDKNANFKGLGTKNGYLWQILPYGTHLGSILLDCAMGIVA